MRQLNILSYFPEWWYKGKCSEVGEELFLGTAAKASNLTEARKVCVSCPVLKDCLTHALEEPEEWGIWAGTSAMGRETMRKAIESGHKVGHVVDTVIENGFRWKRER